MQIQHAWDTLRRLYRDAVAQDGATYVSEVHAQRDRSFVEERFTEGVAVAQLLHDRLGANLQVLDIGTGNCGVALAVANAGGNQVIAIDHRLNAVATRLIRESALPLRFVGASGAEVPMKDESFDAVLCLETIEHTAAPERFGAEIMRVLKPGGVCVLTTPARTRFLFRRDPHFAIPGLLLLPDKLQRWVVTRVARIVPDDEYDVSHIYWYAGTLARLFPGRDEFQAVGAPPQQALARRWWSASQRFLWPRVVVRKQRR